MGNLYTALNADYQLRSETVKTDYGEFKIYKESTMSDKNDIVNIALDKSLTNGIYDPVKLDMYFHLNLVYIYAPDFLLDNDDREDEFKLYDLLTHAGLIDLVVKTIGEKEYRLLYKYLEDTINERMKYNNSFAGIVNNILMQLPEQMESAKNIMETFDPEKFQMLQQFARSAGNITSTK